MYDTYMEQVMTTKGDDYDLSKKKKSERERERKKINVACNKIFPPIHMFMLNFIFKSIALVSCSSS